MTAPCSFMATTDITTAANGSHKSLLNLAGAKVSVPTAACLSRDVCLSESMYHLETPDSLEIPGLLEIPEMSLEMSFHDECVLLSFWSER